MIEPQTPTFTPPNPALWANIPEEMKARPQWCFCTLRPDTNGKKDKIPRDPKASAVWAIMAAVDDPRTWGTFDQACEAARKIDGGIGFVLTADDPVAIIDLDPLDKTGKRRPPEEIERMQALLNMHLETYCELSQSGIGAHIIVSHDGPVGLPGVNLEGIEAYSQGRFVICTGNVDFFGGAKALGTAEGYHRLVEKMVTEGGRTDIAVTLEPCGTPSVTDDLALAQMFKRRSPDDPLGETKGQKLKRWHEDGPRGGEDWSGCDQAYLNEAVFACKGNWEQAINLFQSSRLWRGEGAKFKKSGHTGRSYSNDYVPRTVSKAMERYERRERENEQRGAHGRELVRNIVKML